MYPIFTISPKNTRTLIIVSHCNLDIFGLSLTSEVNTTSLCLLDLELSHLESTITAKSYTKSKSGNLHFTSCHHHNVPKSQFCSLRHNFTRKNYNIQRVPPKQTFLEKGYPSDLIDQAHMVYNTNNIPKPKQRS